MLSFNEDLEEPILPIVTPEAFVELHQEDDVSSAPSTKIGDSSIVKDQMFFPHLF
jgi:hypothetical protein